MHAPADTHNQPARPALVGIDLGGTSLRLARLEWNRAECVVLRTPAAQEAERILRGVLRLLACGSKDVLVGVSRAPAIDRAGVISEWPNRPTWIGLRFMSWVLADGALLAGSEDDGLSAAIWEHAAMGADAAAECTLCLSIGTGLAVGVVARGEPVNIGEGAQVIAHRKFGRLRGRCACGRRGCIQTALSVEGIADALRNNTTRRLRSAFEEFIANLRRAHDVSQIVLTGGAVPRFGAPLLQQLLAPVAGMPLHFSLTPSYSALGGALSIAARRAGGAPRWRGPIGVLLSSLQDARGSIANREVASDGLLPPGSRLFRFECTNELAQLLSPR